MSINTKCTIRGKCRHLKFQKALRRFKTVNDVLSCKQFYIRSLLPVLRDIISKYANINKHDAIFCFQEYKIMGKNGNRRADAVLEIQDKLLIVIEYKTTERKKLDLPTYNKCVAQMRDTYRCVSRYAYRKCHAKDKKTATPYIPSYAILIIRFYNDKKRISRDSTEVIISDKPIPNVLL